MMTRATPEVSWNGMLLDWEGVGPERRFEVRVPNVLQAGKFYRDVFGAEETFRQQSVSTGLRDRTGWIHYLFGRRY